MTSIIIKTPSGSSIAMENIIYAIAREAEQPGLTKKLLIQLNSDIFLDERAWNDILKEVKTALQHFITTKQLSLSAFKQITLKTFVTNFGLNSEIIWI